MTISDAGIEAISGSIGSVIATVATYPLMIASTWQAIEHQQDEQVTNELRQRYKGLPSPVKELCMYTETGGWRSLFAGLKPCITATAISQAVYFYLYSALRQSVVSVKRQASGTSASTSANSRTEDIGVLGSLVVASLAGCGNVLATNPVWVVATQIQANQRRPQGQGQAQSAFDIAVQLYKESGLLGFWKGVLPSLLMVSNPTLQYIMYEWLTARLLDMRRSKARLTAGAKQAVLRLTPLDAFLISALSKLGATLITYPMLLIKNRMQSMNSSTQSTMRYTGVLDAVLRISRDEGPGAFFKGMRLKMMQTVLAAALLMSIREGVYTSTRAVLKPGK